MKVVDAVDKLQEVADELDIALDEDIELLPPKRLKAFWDAVEEVYTQWNAMKEC